MLLFIQCGLFAAYLTRMLLFVEKVDHFGPFPSTKLFIHRTRTNYAQQVTLFDWIRRFTPFNPYLIQGDLWVINESRLEVWSCPFCLSFWTSLIATAAYGFTVQTNPLELVTVHFSISFISMLLNYMVDYVQLRSSQSS